MKEIVPRTVTVVGEETGKSQTLSEFRSERAYVLLGDPGAGKTTAFRTEVGADPEGSIPITARRFTRRSLDRRDEWRRKTLFIDGLDEVRAGSRDARQPIDDVLDQLDRLGHPNFRVSCRSADWLGRNDLKEIVATAGYENLKVLRLDPLNETDIRRVIASLNVAGPDAFIAEARDRGLHGWLGNPHLLELLAKAVKTARDGDWPAGRCATFEKACTLSVREYNEEHRAADHNVDPVSVERILSAAGHLSALLLLSDTESVCAEKPEEDWAFSLSDVRGAEDADYGRALRRALQSPLFADHTDLGRLPVHRQIVEFLGGRYLAERIGPEFPASRVLALMEGFDGVVVPHLRGLAAWLAAFSPETRPRLIETDPVGAALYGDVTHFSADQRNRLLRAFERRPDEIRAWDWPEVALRSLLDPCTIETLRTYLGDDDRSEGRQAVVRLLLRALSHAPEHLPPDVDLRITIRDASWPKGVRVKALRALLSRARHDPEWTAGLMDLLGDVWSGRIEDRDRELLVVMLRDLYPAHVPPDEIWDYLLPDQLSGNGEYDVFWRHELVKKTGDRTPELANALVQRDAEWLQSDSDDLMPGVVHDLVLRAIRVAGDEAAPSTVFSWLQALDSGARLWGSGLDALSGIRRWLAARPDLQKKLALEGLSRYRGCENYPYRALEIRRTVLGWHTTDDFAEWCLRQAVETAPSHHDAAFQLLAWSRPWGDEGSDSGLSLSQVRAATAHLPRLRAEVERFASPPKDPEVNRHAREKTAEYATKRAREEAEFVAAARAQIEQLRAGICGLRLLHKIADAYLQVFDRPPGPDPTSRVAELLGGDAELTDAALAGLRNVLDRDDLPNLRDLIRLNENNRMSLLALPVLAGLDHLGANAREGRTEADILRAVGLYYLIPCRLYDAGRPPWYNPVLQSNREALAEALVRVTRSRIRSKKHSRCLWSLSRDPAHRHVARIAVPALWRSFPTRCTEPQVEGQKELLRAAIRWRVDGIAEIVAERLRADLDVAQRASWLCTGLLASPGEYVSDVVSFVEDGDEARCQHIVDFLAPFERNRWRTPAWDTPVLEAMIGLVASRYTPWLDQPGPDDYLMGRDMRARARGLIQHWARTLSRRTDEAATAALTTLSEEPSLEAWRGTLRHSLDAQIVTRRSATFAAPSFDAVQGTLRDGPPASAADLSALVAVAFDEIGEQLRHGNTDGWRQFWHESTDSDGPRPMHEDRCRDRLLDALRPKLPSGVDAQPEGHYAEDKRADIRVSYGGFAIPVEIKKNHHRQLWSAASDQLVAKYARDPESDGYGIYLVLWFGPENTPGPPSGPPPRTPDELRDRLATSLPDCDRPKINVVVLDLSRRKRDQERKPNR
ncbi:NACHT domain-containing protein [Candidatus Palauibacter sp.]|uniref:NACHT domain-containing protein n=1 Tax=Candidatus Palauibacter sp. TaxID=3101350 RepID=UPI003AF2DADC